MGLGPLANCQEMFDLLINRMRVCLKTEHDSLTCCDHQSLTCCFCKINKFTKTHQHNSRNQGMNQGMNHLEKTVTPQDLSQQLLPLRWLHVAVVHGFPRPRRPWFKKMWTHSNEDDFPMISFSVFPNKMVPCSSIFTPSLSFGT